ncbi:MAG: hypothetical protein ACRDP4_10810, partial [Nocardioidaceae bacterium]
ALHDSTTRDPVDADAFLGQVHKGARGRRARHVVAGGVAALVVVAGGGFAVNATGVLGNDPSPVAGPSRTTTTPSPLDRTQSAPSTSSPSRPTTTTPSTASRPTTISPGSPLSPDDVHALSLTATGSNHQWVLAATPGRDCEWKHCATIFATTDGGAHWQTKGQLPAPTIVTGSPGPSTVDQVRFAGSGSDYDGWVYGESLWSTHDSGASWQRPDVGGSVYQLAAWGDHVYAAVSSNLPGDDTSRLLRSPVSHDDWKPVDVGVKMASIESIAVAKGGAALIYSNATHMRNRVLVSTDGQRWTDEQPCPGQRDPIQLSTAGPSLWVACSGKHTITLQVSTDEGQTWQPAVGTFPLTGRLAARDGSAAVVAGPAPGVAHLVSTTGPPAKVSQPLQSAVSFAGFTNDSTGYLVGAKGKIVHTTDGGRTWTPYVVTPTP